MPFSEVLESLFIYTGKDQKSYEPYGYKIPVLTQPASGESREHIIYLKTPLYTGDSYTETDLKGIKLFKGQNTISVNTSVTPEAISIEYMR